MKRLFVYGTDVDFRSAFSPYVIFAVALIMLGLAGRFLGVDVTVAGTSVVKHVSDIMVEHEAAKTIVGLSIVVFVLG